MKNVPESGSPPSYVNPRRETDVCASIPISAGFAARQTRHPPQSPPPRSSPPRSPFIRWWVCLHANRPVPRRRSQRLYTANNAMCGRVAHAIRRSSNRIFHLVIVSAPVNTLISARRRAFALSTGVFGSSSVRFTPCQTRESSCTSCASCIDRSVS